MKDLFQIEEFKKLLDRINILLSRELERYEKSENKDNFDATAFNKLFVALKGSYQDLQIAYMESDEDEEKES